MVQRLLREYWWFFGDAAVLIFILYELYSVRPSANKPEPQRVSDDPSKTDRDESRDSESTHQ